jgi:hypothetical protein
VTRELNSFGIVDEQALQNDYACAGVTVSRKVM